MLMLFIGTRKWSQLEIFGSANSDRVSGQIVWRRSSILVQPRIWVERPFRALSVAGGVVLLTATLVNYIARSLVAHWLWRTDEQI